MKKKTIKTKKVKKTLKKKKLEEHLDNSYKQTYKRIWKNILNDWKYKKPTKKEFERMKKQEKVRRANELKEKRRRAKIMKITVGEYEDAIEEARYNSY